MNMQMLALHCQARPDGRSPRYWTRRVLAMALVLVALIAGPAYAGTCAYAPEAPTFLPAITSLAGNITVGRDVPVGTEVYRATFNTNRLARISCQPGTYTRTRRYLSNPWPLSSYVHPTYGNRVYQTSVPGIGAVIWVGGNALPTTNTDIFAIVTNLTAATAFDVSLIKTGPVGAGTIRGSDLPTFEYAEIGNNTIRMLLGSFTGSINVVSRTCTTPDVPVALGTHYTSELKGVGTTTSAWVDVPVALNNCPAFFGVFRGALTNDSGVTQRSTANAISYRVDPVTSVVNAAQGVMALQPLAGTTTATGIGIQMANAANSPVSYGTTVNSGLALNQTNGSNYTIPLKARYYQTAATPTAGQANGAATITLIYN
jgi:type 1 fimbria pilin